MKRVFIRLFSILYLFLALGAWTSPARAMDDLDEIVYKYGHVKVTKKDLDDFKNQKIDRRRYEMLKDLAQELIKYDDLHHYTYAQYGQYSFKINTWVSELTNAFKKERKRTVRFPSFKKKEKPVSPDDHPSVREKVVLQNNDICITQGDINDLRDKIIDKHRYKLIRTHIPALAQHSYKEYQDMKVSEVDTLTQTVVTACKNYTPPVSQASSSTSATTTTAATTSKTTTATTTTQSTTPASPIVFKKGKVEITQDDIDKLKNKAIKRDRFKEIMPVIATLMPSLKGMTYDDYQDKSAWRIYEIADDMSKTLKDLQQLQSVVSSFTSPATSTSDASIIFQDEYFIITQDDMARFRNGTLSEARYEACIQALATIMPDLRFIDYEGYQERDVAKRHELVDAIVDACAANAQAHTPQQKKKKIILPSGYEVTDAHVKKYSRAFANKTISEEEFDTLVDALADDVPALDDLTYDQYKLADPTDIADIIKETLEYLTSLTDKDELPAKIKKITQADIDNFADGSLTKERFYQLQSLLASEIPDIADMSYFQYYQLFSGVTGAALDLATKGGNAAISNIGSVNTGISIANVGIYVANASINLLNKGVQLVTQRTTPAIPRIEHTLPHIDPQAMGIEKIPSVHNMIVSMLVMTLNMHGGNFRVPKPPMSFADVVLGAPRALAAAALGVGQFALDGVVDTVTTIQTRKNQFKVRKDAQLKDTEGDRELNTLMAEVDEVLKEYDDETIDKIVSNINPRKALREANKEKIARFKNQNTIIAGGLLPERIELGLHMRFDPNTPYPVALYKKDLVYGTGFAVKACVAYWVISRVSVCRAYHIYNEVLKHADELVILLENLKQYEQDPESKKKKRRTWHEYALHKITGQNHDSTPLWNLKQHIDTHHLYIGYNPFKFRLLGHFAVSLLSKAGTAYAYDKFIEKDDNMSPEARMAYYEDDDGKLEPLPGDYMPLSVTEVVQSLSLGGLYNTAVNKIPSKVRDVVPVPLTKREIVEKLSQYSPEKLKEFLASDNMMYIGLLATTILEIKFMNDQYHARWHQWIMTHQDYLLELLKKYQQVRHLPEHDEARVQLEEEILVSIHEGNACSGFNRATIWAGISRTAFNKVTFACTAPILAYAFWHHRKLVGNTSWMVAKECVDYAAKAVRMIPTLVRMTPMLAQLGMAGAIGLWQHKGEIAQAVIVVPVYTAMGIAEIGIEVVQGAAMAVATAAITTAATIAQNKKVQKYGHAAIELYETSVEKCKEYAQISKQTIEHIKHKRWSFS